MKQGLLCRFLPKCILILLILSVGFTVNADESDDGDAGETSVVYAVDFENFLESQTQEQPSDSQGQNLVRTAGVFGAQTNNETYSRSELDNGPAIGMNFDKASSITHASGYSRSGMEDQIGARAVVNSDVLNLFQKYAHLRSEAGVHLPPQFASLINFTEQYIQTNALQEAEANNGFSHHTLAIQVVRASFCFGNDPFMMLSKMRRETNFSRKSVSPTGAVGFSQMTTIAVKEIQDQLSGNLRISAQGSKAAFQESIRCFTGISNYELPSDNTQELKNRVKEKWGFDIVLGQMLVKTLVSAVRALQPYGSNAGGMIASYEDAFSSYNGDSQLTQGICLRKESVQMRDEYACDVISQFTRMNAQWNRFVQRGAGKDLI